MNENQYMILQDNDKDEPVAVLELGSKFNERLKQAIEEDTCESVAKIPTYDVKDLWNNNYTNFDAELTSEDEEDVETYGRSYSLVRTWLYR